MKTFAELLDEFEEAVRHHANIEAGIAEGHYHLDATEAEEEVKRLRHELFRAVQP